MSSVLASAMFWLATKSSAGRPTIAYLGLAIVFSIFMIMSPASVPHFFKREYLNDISLLECAVPRVATVTGTENNFILKLEPLAHTEWFQLYFEGLVASALSYKEHDFWRQDISELLRI